MNSKSRTSNSIRNVSVSVGMQVLLLLMSFVGRTIFISVLGEHYLGINGLYTNILSVLSLADLGINTVMIYALYKPLAINDNATISRLVNYFKKLYRWVALGVFVLGIACVPFLQFIIKDSALPLNELRLYYLLYVGNTVCSYLIVYKSTLINADQRMYVIKMVDFVSSISLQILQIIILLFTGNFLFYLVTSIGITLIKNLTLNHIANRSYPFLRYPDDVPVEPAVREKLKENIKSIFVYRVSTTIMNSTDNILIAVILGTVVVGQYSNYLLIITAINGLIMLVAQSVIASLGNFNVTESPARKLMIFRCMLLFFCAVATFCSCCFLSMFNDFISIWIGKVDPDYVLSDYSVYAITFNFFISCVLTPIWMFRESTGLFNQVKYSMMSAAIINIILSIILGNIMGLSGIVAATAISKLLTNFWYEPKILFREVFQLSTKAYWKFILRLLLIALPCLAICITIGKALPGTIPYIILKIFISGIVTLVAFCLINYRTEEFSYLYNAFLAVKNRKGRRNVT